MPLIMERQCFFVGLLGLGVNNALAYPNYFAMIPTGPDPNAALTEGFFALAAQQQRRPATVALVSADAEFSRNPILGAKANAQKYGFKIIHEVTYPLTTKDFTPVIDTVAESNCDLLFLCSYLSDSIGLVRIIRAHRFRPKMVGGGMIGPQNTAVKTALGPLLNARRTRPHWRTNLVANQQLRWYRTSLVGRMPAWCPSVAPVGPWRRGPASEATPG